MNAVALNSADVENVLSKDNLVSERYDHIITRFDPEHGIVWCQWNPQPRACFTPELLRDIKKFQEATEIKVNNEIIRNGTSSIEYFVLTSNIENVYSFGGDLALFSKAILNKDREMLTNYIRLCFDTLYWFVGHNLPITTISLIQGTAFGAGFEAALACDVRIAKKSAQMGFPEVLFNMFPGMGAYSFLVRKIGEIQTEKMILNGKPYVTDELYQMGIIDVLAENDDMETSLLGYVKEHKKYKNTHRSIMKVRKRVNPINREELIDVANIWVDAAMQLSVKDIRIMERLVKAQYRKNTTPTSDDATLQRGQTALSVV